MDGCNQWARKPLQLEYCLNWCWLIAILFTLVTQAAAIALTSTAVMRAPRLGGDRKPRQANTAERERLFQGLIVCAA